ncbi:ethanolamine ammonia-lyase subunit EutB [Archangium lansingense]|uniref:Ethanolamine ammonia-lyase subunit EutB n=1 Tax=Archangium lansingense TaxID=2995310 RepID=A0ABT3ZY11_9BACT|nr:ethanolamine ammonia-lyase subunit EutB [Archangium lansinium]MCY1074298.1 ethanolamine ammonia-lyase subunit EutB [Archangium lansinium]
MPIALLGCKEEQPPAPPPGVYIPSVKAGESVFGYLARTRGGFDLPLYRQLIGAANEYKEGDEAAGLAAADATSRANARLLLRPELTVPLPEGPDPLGRRA